MSALGTRASKKGGRREACAAHLAYQLEVFATPPPPPLPPEPVRANGSNNLLRSICWRVVYEGLDV